MAELNEKMIDEIMDKAEKESERVSFAYHKKNENSLWYDKNLTNKDLLKIKTIYTKEELDFVIENYGIRRTSNTLLKNCLYLLDEYKQTNQPSKCNAIYNILNKYFTIVNCYDDPYDDHPLWDSFDITGYAKCPTVLKDMINDKVLSIKAEKDKQTRLEYKEKADKTDKEIIEELEL